jgi:hypothetical protein
MSVLTTLYPPRMESFMPAFVYNTTVKVYFGLSEFNSFSEIANAQITVTNQNTNLSVLDKAKYPSEIMLKEIQTDNTRADDKYYIEINTNDIENGFSIDEYYNVQIRFTSTEAGEISLSTPQALDSWLTTNLDYFSEWSRVCIIRAISLPTMTVSGYDIQDGHIIWSMSNSNLLGTLNFSSDEETEQLKSYQVKLFDENNLLLTDSGILYSDNYNNPNSFIYNFKYGFEVGKSYSFIINYETNNLYTNSISITFDVIEEPGEDLDFSFGSKIDEENARVDIDIKRSEDKPSFTGKIIIRRTSSESNFTI